MGAVGFIDKAKCRVNQAFAIAFVCAILAFGGVLADHLYMANAETYPEWASEPIVIEPHSDNGIEGISQLCGHRGGWEFYAKVNGVFLRCSTIMTGSLGRPKTYLIKNIDQLVDQSN